MNGHSVSNLGITRTLHLPFGPNSYGDRGVGGEHASTPALVFVFGLVHSAYARTRSALMPLLFAGASNAHCARLLVARRCGHRASIIRTRTSFLFGIFPPLDRLGPWSVRRAA